MPPEPSIERLLPALVHVQTHLDEDLSLEVLAAKSFLAPTYFHRTFRAAIGETCRTYVERLRLERAAFLLGIDDRTVLELALEVGYARPETFSRAFRRHFGTTPRTWRSELRSQLASRRQRARDGLEAHAESSVSGSRVRRFKPMHVAFIRHTGPYEDAPPELFEELLDWARRTGRDQAPLLLGLGHDAPGVTPPEKLRFDACVRVPEVFRADGRIGHQVLPGGPMASAVHVGPFSTLGAAWGQAFAQAMALPAVQPRGLPALEIYDTVTIDPLHSLNQTELCLWLEPRPA